jgi:hypothetical protein
MKREQHSDAYVQDGFRPVQGPFQVYQARGSDPITVLSLPFDRVRGGHVAITVQDNLSIANPTGVFNRFLACAIVEVTLVGLIKGIETAITTQPVRQLTGPMVVHFDLEDNYETLDIRARMMRGGVRFADTSSDAPFKSTSGFRAQLTVSLNPRRRGLAANE